MATTNDITGDVIQTRSGTDNFRDKYHEVFAKREVDRSKHSLIVKFDGGRGALLCSNCKVVIGVGLEHEDKAHYCEDCI